MTPSKVALIAWRYTAAAVVLGVTLLQRVVQAKPPLTVATVQELCQEPTLGRPHEALFGAGSRPAARS